MKRKKKKKINYSSIFFYIFVICIILLLVYIKSDENVVDIPKIVSRSFIDIVEVNDIDSNIVDNVFNEGLSLNEFKKINEKDDNYIVADSNIIYKKLNYNFTQSLHYSDIEDYLMKLNYSDIVKLEVIGSSMDNRNIYSIEIGKGDNILLVDANIHAAETSNTIMLLQYIIDIVNKYESGDKDIINILNDSKLVVLPCINPDGYEVYNFGIDSLNNKDLWLYVNRHSINFDNFKSNANGVDLNRNMPTQNAGMYFKGKNLIDSVSLKKTTSSKSYYGGEYLGSEPETKALIYFMLKHYKNTFAYIDLHNQGRVIYQGKPNLSNNFNNDCKNFAQFVKSYNNYVIYGIESEEVGEGNDGSATDFMAELANNFKYSSITGRLSNSRNITDTDYKYKYPVITMETTVDYTRDTNVYKNEYYNYKFYDLFTYLLKNKSYMK